MVRLQSEVLENVPSTFSTENEFNPSRMSRNREVRTDSVDSTWDVVVLGKVDACWVCQFGPPPHVRYMRVLAGKAPGGRPKGQLPLVGVAERLLPEGGTPLYRSQQEEIVFLERVVPLRGYEGADAYRVVDVLKATPENVARFLGPRRRGKI
ncbi:MAG: hypothetical protein AAB393_05875 [Bacteroidota bacterium]